jgi:ethanolamine utilization protein EutN
MFLARIDGTLTSTAKHPSLEGSRFLIGQRLEADGSDSGEPLVLLDTLGARHGSIVLVTTDGDALRAVHGNNVPARNSVIGLVHSVQGELP